MKVITLILIVVGTIISCTGQGPGKSDDRLKVGGPCEGCEAALEYEPNALEFIDTTVSFYSNPRLLELSGIVYKSDKVTPAAGVVLYMYHTDQNGRYSAEEDAQGWGRRHGKNRAWMKTNQFGEYRLVCGRPAAYPDSSEPEHIHIVVVEQGLYPYYIDDVVFLDDELLKEVDIERRQNRGGSGVVNPTTNRTVFNAQRDIILGLNIPDYPK